MATGEWEVEQRRRAAVYLADRMSTELRPGVEHDGDVVIEIGPAEVSIDLRRLDHIDCNGLGALLDGADRFDRLGVHLRVLHANRRVAWILDLVGLDVETMAVDEDPDPDGPAPRMYLF